MKDNSNGDPTRFEICFVALHHRGDSCAFPCDGQGLVDLDALSEQARNNYLFARALVRCAAAAVPRIRAVPAMEPALH